MDDLKWIGEIFFGPYGGAFAFGVLTGASLSLKFLFQYVVQYQRKKIDEQTQQIITLNEKMLDIARGNS